MAFDLLLLGGTLIDGTGSPGKPADVGISEGRIAAIGSLRGSLTRRVLDIQGKVVCPGFIDIHAHGEEQLLVTPGAEAKLMQGITTMVGGNCGISAAPIAGPLASFVNASGIFPSVQVDWATFEEFFARVESGGTAINLACLVGNATLRACVLGMESRQPYQAELNEMKRLAAQAMAHGAVGFSSGLVYAPGCYADTRELIELARVAAEHGGFYASHVRGMARPIVDAVREAIRIGKEASLPVQVSHLNPGYPFWGRIPQLMEILDAARSKGLDVTSDTLLYPQSIFSAGSLLPNWANEGGLPALLKRLQDPETRHWIKEDTLHYGDEKGGSVASCLLQEGKWDLLWLTQPVRFKLKNLAEVAALTGHEDPFDALLDLILAEKGAVRGISQPYCQEDIDLTVAHPLCMPGSDDQPVSRLGPVAPWHRRGYGSFARLLGWYVREHGLLTMEAAIAKSTSLPARRLKLAGRGLVKEGFFADLLVFDPDVVRDTGTDDDPACYPEGIECVLVNGQFAVEAGTATGARSGRVLRHTPDSRDFHS